MTDEASKRVSPSSGEDAREFAVAAARIAHENKAEDIEILDLRELSAIADFFVIGTGTSSRQMSAVADHIKDHARALDRRPFRATDPREGKWVLADYVDVVIHLFDADHREFYDLASLWGDAPRVEWLPEEPTESPAE
ncbi:MAG: ribosome silencing factor [Phycisphaerae bacterium]|nr:ribosome silencing factor [Phycisphaerae bacterium]